MRDEAIYECKVNTNVDGDTFVGIRSDGDKIIVCFPLGYKLGDSDAEKKKDIQLLIRVLSRFAGIKEKLLPQMLIKNPETVNFPIQAYLNILDDYYTRNGYYTENEIVYRTNNKRPANWSRTIRTKKAYPQDGSFVYLDTVARETVVDSSNMLTKINQFCVEESYKKIGWLFTSKVPPKSTIPFQEKVFLTTIQDKLSHTNNTNNKLLFSSMIDMIQYVGKKGQNAKFFFGTDRFEYVWERLIDFNFGIDGKDYYFPRTTWYLGAKGTHAKSALEPDTIMIGDDRNKIFILDAKYYKYGATTDPADLPRSTSINKQIIYGEYVATEPKFKNEQGLSPRVYNVFLMPYNCNALPFRSGKSMMHIGEARGDWKTSGAEYENVQGILLDVKWLMSKCIRHNKKDISELAAIVESVFNKTVKTGTA